MRPTSFTACIFALFFTLATAQTPARKEPAVYIGGDHASRPATPPPGMRLNLSRPREFALGTLSEAERAHLATPSTQFRVGIRRALPEHTLATGNWETAAEGTRVWRIALRSPGSVGLRVEFDNFAVGDGQVWIHDGTHVAGPYTGRGIFGDGHFWSATLSSNSVIVEYQPAAGVKDELEPPFLIRAISHQIRTLDDASATPTAAPPTAPVNTADYCEMDVTCYFPTWQSSASSVAQISYVDGGDSFLCSGSLLSTRDNSFIPYFLTAGHCINNEAAARTVEAYWTYQTSTCNGTPPASNASSAKSSVGGHLINFAPVDSGDYSLVLLPDVPSGVTFAGWDITDPPVTTDLIGIHHPSGSWKRISFGQRVGDATNIVGGVTVPGSNVLQVQWNQGRTEHGSSGSPIFSAPGVVTGSLSYGEIAADGTVCTIKPSVSGYSRFSNTYTQVQSYLENQPSVLVKPSKSTLSFTVANQTAPAAQSVQLTTQSSGQITYKLRADAPWILLSNFTGTASAKSPATATVSLDPTKVMQPGSYSSTVSILSGAAAPQYITVKVVVQVPQSSITASISPNPVVQSGGQWNFQIQLSETAGVATHVTALKFSGMDYSSSIATWFGTTAIPANGTITAPLTVAGLFPHGDQYVEFWGTDDASGQPWYRVAVVTFQ
jgi:hypothetical protein